jgi:hypothetical protein
MDNRLIEKYLLQDCLATYDPYDIWKTKIGIVVKRFYFQNKYLGLIPAGILTIYDLYINNKFRLLYKKQEYPIVRAQAALCLLNLYEHDKKNIYLEYARKHIDWLINNSSKGYHGYCWGLNFNWIYSATEIYDKNIPFSTHTPYPLEALIKYYKITQNKSILEVIKSIFLFLENDIKVMKETNELLILSYGVEKDRIVSNSNSYIMYMYALLLDFFPEKESYIKNKILKIYNFIISVQHENGSWLYSPYDINTFIDCFHSAFVIKNIIKTNNIVKLNQSLKIVKNGYSFIIDNFLDKKEFLFKRFSKSNKISLVKFDLYDNAEMLTLSINLDDNNTKKKLKLSIIKNFTKDEDISSTIDLFSIKRNNNHLRWAIIPYLYALSLEGTSDVRNFRNN